MTASFVRGTVTGAAGFDAAVASLEVAGAAAAGCGSAGGSSVAKASNPPPDPIRDAELTCGEMPTLFVIAVVLWP
jgi:hypothetical protein